MRQSRILRQSSPHMRQSQIRQSSPERYGNEAAERALRVGQRRVKGGMHKTVISTYKTVKTTYKTVENV